MYIVLTDMRYILCNIVTAKVTAENIACALYES